LAKRDAGADRGVVVLDAVREARRKAEELALICDGKNRIKACEYNVKQLLGADPQYSAVHYDEFIARARNGKHDWTDHDDRAALIGLQAAHQVPGFTLGQVRNAVQALAFERRRDSLREFIKGLPQWDGTARIEHAFCDGWGAADTPLTRAASRNFFIAMVARALKPGAQVDTLWAFEGPQGKLKSRSFRELGGELHAEISAPIGDPNFFRELRGVAIAELSELDSLRGREASTVKRLLSAVQDRFVEKYEKHATAYPRRAVFVATTNEAVYWQDSTGARRLVPIKVGEIDISVIASNREQWLAEARTLFERGESWWEYPSDIEVAQEERQQVDPWEDLLRALIANGRTVHITPEMTDNVPWPQGFITSAEIMRDWLRLAPHQQGASCGVRLGKVMRRLGFRPDRQGKSRERGWVRAADTQRAAHA
jgi:putative DNA primase/helicase